MFVMRFVFELSNYSEILQPGGCFINNLQALQNDITKIYNARNHVDGENFRLKLST